MSALEVNHNQAAFPFSLAAKANGNGTAFKDPAFMENRRLQFIGGFRGLLGSWEPLSLL